MTSCLNILYQIDLLLPTAYMQVLKVIAVSSNPAFSGFLEQGLSRVFSVLLDQGVGALK